MHIDIDEQPLEDDFYGTGCCHPPAACLTKGAYKNMHYILEKPKSYNFCFSIYIISGFPAAIAHVAGPSLAPLFKNTCTT